MSLKSGWDRDFKGKKGGMAAFLLAHPFRKL